MTTLERLAIMAGITIGQTIALIVMANMPEWALPAAFVWFCGAGVFWKLYIDEMRGER